LKVDLEDAITRHQKSNCSKKYEFPGMDAPITGEENQDFSVKQLRGISFKYLWGGEEQRMVAWVSPLESTHAIAKLASLLQAHSPQVPFASNSKSNSFAAAGAGIQRIARSGGSSFSCIKKIPLVMVVLYAFFIACLIGLRDGILNGKLRWVGTLGLIVTILTDIGLCIRGSKQSLIAVPISLLRRRR